MSSILTIYEIKRKGIKWIERQNFVRFNYEQGTVIFTKDGGRGEKRKEVRCSNIKEVRKLSSAPSEKGQSKNKESAYLTFTFDDQKKKKKGHLNFNQ